MTKRTCSIDGCDRVAEKRGWCTAHYKRWLRHGDPRPGVPVRRFGGVCSIDDCGRPVKARDLCASHYARWRKHGDPRKVLRMRPSVSFPANRGSGRTTQDGYICVLLPAHPLANSQGWVREHRVVAYDAGLLIDPTDIVHHINGDKTDNRVENLEVMSQSAHCREHEFGKRTRFQKATGRTS